MGENQEKRASQPNQPRKRTKLIFNPEAGAADQSPARLMEVIREMQACNLVPETFLVEPDCDLQAVVRDALKEGFRMFVVCGGDGTIDAVAGALAETRAILGIIPTGTQNNVALSLGIPEEIPEAVATLREGQRIQVDTGVAACGETQRHFLEICSVGLLSALYPSADDIQHGNLAKVGDFVTTLLASPPSEMRLVLDEQYEIHTESHGVLVANMPYVGPNFQVGTPAAMQDNLLDVLLFAELSKLELLGNAVQVARGELKDTRIQHYKVRKIDIHSNPAMPVMVDGTMFGEGTLRVHVQSRNLTVMAGNLNHKE